MEEEEGLAHTYTQGTLKITNPSINVSSFPIFKSFSQGYRRDRNWWRLRWARRVIILRMRDSERREKIKLIEGKLGDDGWMGRDVNKVMD